MGDTDDEDGADPDPESDDDAESVPDTDEPDETDEAEEPFDTEPGPPVIPFSPSLSWNQPYGGTARRSTHGSDIEPADIAALQWIHSYPPSALGRNPILAAGEYAALSVDGDITAIDPEDGTQRWRLDTINGRLLQATESNVTATSTTVEEVVVADYDPTDGSERSSVMFTPQWGSRTLIDETLYTTRYDSDENEGVIFTTDLTDGSQRWRTSIGNRRPGASSIDDDNVYFGVERTDLDEQDGAVFALDRETGEERWRFDALTRVWAPPAVTESTIFVAARDGSEVLTAIETDTGELRWQVEARNGTRVPPVVDDDRVYLGTADDELRAFDRETGDTVWEVTTDGNTSNGPMALVGSTLYVPRSGAGKEKDRSRLLAIDANDGSTEWNALLDNRFISGVTPVGNMVVVSTSELRNTDADDRLLAFAAGSTEGTE